MTEPVSIDPETWGTLNEIVQWWRSQHGSSVGVRMKPIFKKADESAYRSMRLPKEMLIEATLKAHKDGIANFNELVKILLWNYLGQDKKYTLQETDWQRPTLLTPDLPLD